MGSGRWDPGDWASYASTHTKGKTVREVINTTKVYPEFDPKGISLRESRDSDDNPRSTAIIVAGDVTGSMGEIAGQLLKDGLNKFATEVYNRRPVTDPHIMFMAVGDADYDRHPLQVTQFEADIRIADQLQRLYVESGGGGNQHESYTLPWYFAARRTAIDCFEKRGEKGILFTYGDEECPMSITAAQLKSVLGETDVKGVDTPTLLEEVEQKYDVYHLVIEQGSYCRGRRSNVENSWRPIMGERVIFVADSDKVPEIMVSILQVRSGVDTTTVAKSWSGDTSLVVKKAIQDLVPGKAGTPTGVVAL